MLNMMHIRCAIYSLVPILTHRYDPGDSKPDRRVDRIEHATVKTMPEKISRALFADALAAFPTLPTGVSHPPYQSAGIDFFPGGTGMCVRNAPFPVGGVMVLGHNYGSDLDFSANVKARESSWRDSMWPTCRNTWKALVRWGIDP